MNNGTRFGMLLLACCLFSLDCARSERTSGGTTEGRRPGSVAAGEDKARSPEGQEGPATGLKPEGTDKYRYMDPDGEGDFTLISRVPTATGQELYLEYSAPFWEKRDPLTLVKIGGFGLSSAGQTHEADRVSEVRNQSFHEMIRKLIKLEYKGEFEGPIEIIVSLTDGSRTVIPAGLSDRAFYRTGVVIPDTGVNLRAEPSVKAKSLGVLAKGTKVFYTGKVVCAPPSDDADLGDAIVFQEVMAEGKSGWAAVGTFDGDEYITSGGFEEY